MGWAVAVLVSVALDIAPGLGTATVGYAQGAPSLSNSFPLTLSTEFTVCLLHTQPSPPPSATPEATSLVLAATGGLGMLSYGLMRLRAGRK